MSDLEVITTRGEHRSLKATTVEQLDNRLRGDLLRASDPNYDPVRTVWNGLIDRRPALIARCSGAADVIESVRFAREHDLLVSVRGGGHNYAGKSVCTDGLMIDLSPMKGIRVEPGRQIAHAQPGVTLGEFDRESQAFGLATTLGVNGNTGIAGLTLGGGIGWLAGKHGLACDNLLSVDVVTADGELMTANAEENPELFWGMRGAGANFGIVTAFEYRLHPLGPVTGGMVLYPMSEAEEMLRFFDEFASTCPDDVSTAAFLMITPDGDPAVAIVACHCGRQDDADDVLKPLRTISTPLADLIDPRPYVEMQSLFDEAWPPGLCYYNKSHIVRRLSVDAIEVFLDYARKMPTPLSVIGFQQVHGAASRVGPGDTAFPHRYDHYANYIHPVAHNPDECPEMIRWAQECWASVRPFVEQAVYVNAVEDAEEEGGERRVREAYGENYERLAALKSEYDPTNFFRLNQNIRPGG